MSLCLSLSRRPRSHSPPPPPALRSVGHPFPALETFCDSFDLPSMSDMEHAHTPYVVVLAQAAAAWKAAHGGTLPTAYDDKQAFKATVAAMARELRESELNLEEACNEAFRVYAPPQIGDALQALLDAPETATPSADATHFRVLLGALRGFIEDPSEGGGRPPLSGRIPDMHSDTAKFVALQELYQTQAAEHQAAIARRAGAILQALGRPADEIPDGVVSTFCKNVLNVNFVRTRSYAEERAAPLLDDSAVYEMADESLYPQTPLLWYLGLRGADAFYAAHGRYPGADDATLAADAAEVWALVSALMEQRGFSCEHVSEKHAAEIARYNACEPHAVAAIVGGVASQEAVKIITHQYTPMQNTCVYNGIAATMGVHEF